VRSEAEIRAEQRYWAGKLEGLQASRAVPTDKLIEAKIWAAALAWVLEPSGEEVKPKGRVQKE
jgi:hypothetical protein